MSNSKRIFLICSVRGASEDQLSRQLEYVTRLEEQGCTVHYPPRDTDQLASGLNICQQNLAAINKSDEVHIFYTEHSQGTHFDMGAAFALRKRIVIADCNKPQPGKSYARMLHEWAEI